MMFSFHFLGLGLTVTMRNTEGYAKYWGKEQLQSP